MVIVVSMNGRLEGADARVSVFDRGFLYGDSVYEVLRTYGGVPFELGLHLERLSASAARIGMRLPVAETVLADETRATHAASGNAESYLRIVVTRGRGPIGLDPALAEDPCRIVIASPLVLPPPESYAEGVAVAVVGVRRNLREALDPQAKTGNYLNSVLALAEARTRGAYEAILLDAHDQVTEGASSNVFAVVGGVVLTPPVRVGILEGITRRSVLEVCRRQGRRAVEVILGRESLHDADELFVTSSIREIVPVVAVDGRPVGDGRPGPVVAALRAGFAELVRERTRAGA